MDGHKNRRSAHDLNALEFPSATQIAEVTLPQWVQCDILLF